jgi:predicted nucleotide-binding protein
LTPKTQKERISLRGLGSLSLSELASSFKTALERCYKDLQAANSASSLEAAAFGSGMKLPTESKSHALELLDTAYEMTVRLKEKENVSEPDIKSLEDHVRAYYDLNNLAAVSQESKQNMLYHLDEATKLFMSMKHHLTAFPAQGRGAAGAPTSRKVFIVHGRDEENKNSLKDMLVRWSFDPIILSEQPNRGRHLLEKLLDHTSDVGFAFVLMTPDDVAATREDFGKLIGEIFGSFVDAVKGRASYDQVDFIRLANELFRSRVRQNVIFEYGLCIGSLGKENVCVLVESNELEIPSDVLGYGHIPFKKTVSECEEQIKRELEAAGYTLPIS